MTSTTVIDDYIASAPEAGRETLRQIAAILRAAAPGATESLKWRKPVWEGRRILYSFTGYKEYATFMPTASSLDGFRTAVEAVGLETTEHTIRIPYGAEVPETLFREIAEHRVRDVEEHDALWVRAG
jgi:uncharacterized protein YdhG (YjbR/CyaY superfamily)